MRPADAGALVVLAAMWGGSFLFIRIAAPVLGPLILVEGRVLLAAAALLLYAVVVGQRPALRARWRQYATVGALNAALPFCLISAAELHLTASLAAILNATTPLFAAVVGAIWLGEHLRAAQVLGLALGLAGVAILVGWSPVPFSLPMLLAVGASLLAALAYALGGTYAARTFRGVAAPDLAIGQQLGAGLLLLPLAAAAGLAAGSAPHVTAVAGEALLALALISTAMAFLLYFRLIANVGPARTLSVTFLVPVFGLLWGALFLHEPLGWSSFAGLGTILAGMVLVTGMGMGRRRAPAGPARQPVAAARGREGERPPVPDAS